MNILRKRLESFLEEIGIGWAAASNDPIHLSTDITIVDGMLRWSAYANSYSLLYWAAQLALLPEQVRAGLTGGLCELRARHEAVIIRLSAESNFDGTIWRNLVHDEKDVVAWIWAALIEIDVDVPEQWLTSIKELSLATKDVTSSLRKADHPGVRSLASSGFCWPAGARDWPRKKPYPAMKRWTAA